MKRWRNRKQKFSGLLSEVFYDYCSFFQAVTKWILESDATDCSPHLQLLERIDAHQSGVNSLALNYHIKARALDNLYDITMATGGDDNKLSLWAFVVDTSKAEKTNISVTNTCNVFGHSAQITGKWSFNILYMASVNEDC